MGGTVDGTARQLGTRLHELVRTVRLIRRRRADVRPLVPLGLVGMLMQIDRLPTGCHARELAARTGLDPSTVSRAIASLVGLGLVERGADPTDMRARVLTVTPDGRAALAEIFDWYGGVLDRALADWTPDEIAALSEALGRFTRDVETALGHHDNLEAAR
ncbi:MULTISPECIES: MarR family winged helix-turn-helix transcriptional regulator [unclassified Micromonospora]|uniref:MarR family winged helix-turn-helix transcriptional regulator n=1 Tax=unclassified Micromonospora TaxID=2617518 RepID=UPI00331D54A8